MSMVVKPCSCASSYQDEKLGKQNRWHNKGKKPVGKVTCTVCGKVS